jgi:hypothetical protein
MDPAFKNVYSVARKTTITELISIPPSSFLRLAM